MNTPDPLSSSLPDYTTDQFRSYAPVLRETFAVLDEDYVLEGVDIPRKTLEDLQWSALLESVARFCISEEARLTAQNLPFLRHRESIERRHREVEESVRLITTDVAPPLQGLDAIGAYLAHARRGGVLDPENLLAVARSARVAQDTHEYFSSRAHLAPLLAQIADDIQVVPSLPRTIRRAFDPSGKLADHASPDLGALRRRVLNYHDRLKRHTENYLKSQDFQNFLQDGYFTVRNDRYVLPIRSGAKGNVPGIVHGTSGSGQTIYIEPTALVELNNDLQLAQMEVVEEERRILQRLTELVAKAAPSLEANIDLLAYLDLTCAMARQAILLGSNRPTLSRDNTLDLRQMRHPLLVLKALEGEKRFEVVPNDIMLGHMLKTSEDDNAEEVKQQILIISGPNTGGKTVTLKSIGISSLMARAGLHIPANPGSEIPLVSSIFSDIGDEQSIERDLSTFSGHVVNINSFLRRINHKSLILLDELFVGTDPAQGSALASALLTRIADKGALVAVTTHLETLKTMAFGDKRFANASVGFDLEQLIPTYSLSMGLPGSSYALRIARRLGLPEDIIQRAQKYADGQGQAEVERVVQELEKRSDELVQERRRVRKERDEAIRSKKRYEKELTRVKKREDDLVLKETKKLMKEIQKARALVKERTKDLQEAKNPKITHESLQKTRKELEERAQKIREQEKKQEKDAIRKERTPASADTLNVGEKVWVKTFKRKGEVIDVQSKKAVVQVGGIRATVNIGEIYLLKSGEQTSRKKPEFPMYRNVKGGSSDAPGGEDSGLVIAPQSPDNTVDLRGMRVDEAIERIEIFMDAVYRSNNPGFYIIHGHGTGALKRAVRQFLPSTRYKIQYRPGERHEGGDGVTVVYLNH